MDTFALIMTVVTAILAAASFGLAISFILKHMKLKREGNEANDGRWFHTPIYLLAGACFMLVGVLRGFADLYSFSMLSLGSAFICIGSALETRRKNKK